MSLPQLRRRIDRIDLHLLRLLNERAKLALQVGALKRARQQPVFDPRRERMVLRQMIEANRGPLSMASVRAIFQEILQQSRKLQTRPVSRRVARH